MYRRYFAVGVPGTPESKTMDLIRATPISDPAADIAAPVYDVR
jgi:hypothetical protein